MCSPRRSAHQSGQHSTRFAARSKRGFDDGGRNKAISTACWTQPRTSEATGPPTSSTGRSAISAIWPRPSTSKKIGGIVDNVSKFAQTLDDNQGNVDRTLKNASELAAKLNNSADRLDGLMVSPRASSARRKPRGRSARSATRRVRFASSPTISTSARRNCRRRAHPFHAVRAFANMKRSPSMRDGRSAISITPYARSSAIRTS